VHDETGDLMKYRLAEGGSHTVYIEHGVWYDKNTGHIHVTVPVPGAKGAHWSYPRTDPKFAAYKAMLQEAGRWPAEAERERVTS
jgi:hypothetical protein